MMRPRDSGLRALRTRATRRAKPRPVRRAQHIQGRGDLPTISRQEGEAPGEARGENVALCTLTRLHWDLSETQCKCNAAGKTRVLRTLNYNTASHFITLWSQQVTIV